MGNRAFIYLPFETGWNMQKLEQALGHNGWQVFDENETRYLHAYTFGSTRQDEASGSSRAPLYAHYTLAPTTSAWEVAPASRRRNALPPAALAFHRIHCYLFTTGTHLMSFELSLLRTGAGDPAGARPMSDPCELATPLANLHRVGIIPTKNNLFQGNRIRKQGDASMGKTLLQLAQEQLGALGCKNAKFFKHVAQHDARANIFVHVEAPNPPDLTMARARLKFAQLEDEADVTHATLSYLASLNNYHTNPWSSSMALLPSMVRFAPDVYWGISDEVLACISYPHLFSPAKNPRSKFVLGTLNTNIRTHYQFLYVLLLHQKYEYYSLLTDLSSRNKNSYNDLLRFKESLESFHADYVYSHVSDVAQYQTLYDEIYAKFGLANMNADVRKPLDSLAKLQQQEEKRDIERKKNEDKKREQGFNTALNVLALITAIAAFNDVNELRDKLNGWHAPSGEIFFWVVFVITGLILVYSLRSLLPALFRFFKGDDSDEQA